MFEGLLLLLIDSEAQLSIEELERILVQEDIQFHVQKALNPAQFLQESSPHIATSITHIISETIEFADFDAALSAMIPVAKPDWIRDSLKESRLLSTKPYSPLVNHFMKNVYLCVADSLQSDKKFLYQAVRAFGGQYLDSLTRFTTHLIAEDMQNDKLLIAASAITDVAIVEPKWLWKSLDGMNLVPEKSYSLAFENKTLQQSEYPQFDDSYINSLEKLSSVFAGKSFYLSPDNDLSGPSRSVIMHLIYRHGGVLSNNVDDVNVYIGQFREGALYERFLQNRNVAVGTLSWFYHVIVKGEWVDPIQLNALHFPLPQQGIPEFSNLKISISNYSGDARFYLSELITIMGGTFTRTLSKENDFLIAASPIGKKYDAVMHKWDSDIKIVNHLWLEDCFTSWQVSDWRDSRYGVGDQTQLLGRINLEAAIYGNSKLKLSPPRKKQKVEKERQEPVDTAVDISKEPTALETPQKQKHIIEETLDMNGKSRRSAARLAAEKLHTNMTDLNDYQQMTKSVRKEKEFMENLESLTPSKKPAMEKAEVVVKSNNPIVTTYAILTGCEPNLTLSRNDVDALKRYGITVLHDYSEKHPAEIIVAPRILRTEKFLKCFGQAKYIVHPKYIEDILAVVNDKQPTKVNVENYWLHKIIEAKLVSEALGTPEKQLPEILDVPERGHVFSGLQINLSTKLDGSVEVISRILKAHQCASTKEIKSIKNLLKSNNGLCILIAHATKDTKLVSSFKKQHPDGVVLKWEWCVKSIFSLKIQDFNQYSL